MEYLRHQVDEALPSDEFIKACGSFSLSLSLHVRSIRDTHLLEEAIIHDTQQTEKAVADVNSSIIVDSTSNIIRRANRVLLVTYQEIENSEDSIFTAQLKQVAERLNESKSLPTRSGVRSTWIPTPSPPPPLQLSRP